MAVLQMNLTSEDRYPIHLFVHNTGLGLFIVVVPLLTFRAAVPMLEAKVLIRSTMATQCFIDVERFEFELTELAPPVCVLQVLSIAPGCKLCLKSTVKGVSVFFTNLRTLSSAKTHAFDNLWLRD